MVEFAANRSVRQGDGVKMSTINLASETIAVQNIKRVTGHTYTKLEHMIILGGQAQQKCTNTSVVKAGLTLNFKSGSLRSS